MNPKHLSTEQALLDRGWTSKDGLWWPPDRQWNLNGISFVNALAWEAHSAQVAASCSECRDQGGWREYDDELNVYWISCPTCGPAGRSEPSSSSGVTGYQATGKSVPEEGQ